MSVPAFVRWQPHFGTTRDLWCPIIPREKHWSAPVRSTHNAEVEGSSPSLSTKSNTYECISELPASVPVFVLLLYSRSHPARIGRIDHAACLETSRVAIS
jgi:hypothetical protein